jgi:hypothetical protein
VTSSNKPENLTKKTNRARRDDPCFPLKEAIYLNRTRKNMIKFSLLIWINLCYKRHPVGCRARFVTFITPQPTIWELSLLLRTLSFTGGCCFEPYLSQEDETRWDWLLFYSRDRVLQKMLDVRFLSTEDQVTDGFTKPFSKQSQLDTKLRLMDDVRQEIELVSNSYVIDCVWLR